MRFIAQPRNHTLGHFFIIRYSPLQYSLVPWMLLLFAFRRVANTPIPFSIPKPAAIVAGGLVIPNDPDGNIRLESISTYFVGRIEGSPTINARLGAGESLLLSVSQKERRDAFP